MHEGLEVTSGDSKELSIIQKPHDMKIKGPRAIVERQVELHFRLHYDLSLLARPSYSSLRVRLNGISD